MRSKFSTKHLEENIGKYFYNIMKEFLNVKKCNIKIIFEPIFLTNDTINEKQRHWFNNDSECLDINYLIICTL